TGGVAIGLAWPTVVTWIVVEDVGARGAKLVLSDESSVRSSRRSQAGRHWHRHRRRRRSSAVTVGNLQRLRRSALLGMSADLTARYQVAPTASGSAVSATLKSERGLRVPSNGNASTTGDP